MRQRQPAMQRKDRHLDAEADEQAGEDQQLRRRRQVARALGHVAHGETVAGRRVVEEEQRHQHEHRAAQRVQEEVERRALAVGAAEAVDQEEQRNQRRFPEDVEERPVARGEHAEHRRFEQQHQREVEPRPLFHAPRDEHGDQAQQRRQQDHRQRNAVDAEREIGPEPDIPRPAFMELDRRPRRIEAGRQPQGVAEGRQREQHRHLPQPHGAARRQHGDQGRPQHRHEYQHLQHAPAPPAVCATVSIFIVRLCQRRRPS